MKKLYLVCVLLLLTFMTSAELSAQDRPGTDPIGLLVEGEVVEIDIEKLTEGNQADGMNDPDVPQIPVGEPVIWTYVVTNTGTVTLIDVTVTDDQGVAVTCPQTTLAPGESMTCTASGTAAAGLYANIGTATGMGSIEEMVEDQDPSHYFGVVPVLDYGDAPDSYSTTVASGGPSHLVFSVFMGALVDPEPDGQPSLLADGDDLDILFPSLGDDEDGVILPPFFTAGDPAATVTVHGGPVGGIALLLAKTCQPRRLFTAIPNYFESLGYNQNINSLDTASSYLDS